LSKYIPNSTKP